MYLKLKKLFCIHDFHLLTSYKKDIDRSVIGHNVKTVYVVYCPKCKTEKEVLEHEYNAIVEKQRLDKEFNK